MAIFKKNNFKFRRCCGYYGRFTLSTTLDRDQKLNLNKIAALLQIEQFSTL